MKSLKFLRKETIRAWLILGCSAAAITGCGAEASLPVTSMAPVETAAAPTEPPATATPEVTAPYRFPLTGLPAQVEMKRRPFMVMVENSPQARPQSGLDQADIVYEILAEGEITRFVSVFQSHEVKTIGPVRSIRPYFVEIGDALDAVIVHAGWSQDAMNILAGRKLNHLDEVYGDGAYYWRASDRKAPHNLYTSTEKIQQGAEAHKFHTDWNGPLLTFAKDKETKLTGSNVSHIEIPYIHGYVVSYDYDAAAGVYMRSMDGEPHKDKETGKQLQTKNLLVLKAKHRIVDKEGRRDVDVFGPGQGMIFQQGKSQEITWERKNGIIRAFAGNAEVPLLPGNTWIQVVPEDTVLKTE